MDQKEIRSFMNFAIETAYSAGKFTLSFFQNHLVVEHKSDGSPVTVADRGAEELIRKTIQTYFPHHDILGEEFGEIDSHSQYRWIIDPIDGTTSFIHGVPFYGVLLGLEYKQEVIVGVSYFPALDEMVAAAKGEGCFLNGRKISVSKKTKLEESTLLYSDVSMFEPLQKHESFHRLRMNTKVHRGWGDCYGHCLVASGRADIMLDPIMNSWDCAALKPILEEAGGTFTDWKGNKTIYGNEALSTNGLLFKPVLACI